MNTTESSKVVAGERSMGLGRSGRVRGSVWRQGRRALVAGAVSVIALVGSGLSAQAAPGPVPLTGVALAESVAAWAQAADAAQRGSGVVPTIPLDPAGPATDAGDGTLGDAGAPVVSGDVVASGQVAAGESSSIDVPGDAADDLGGASVAFSGYQVPETLDAHVAVLDGRAALSAAASTGGVVVGSGLSVVATDASGRSVTSFPTQAITVADPSAAWNGLLKGSSAKSLTPAVAADAGHVPEIQDAVPGVRVEIPVDVSGVVAAGLDVRTLRIYTREGDGDAWAQIPSYFDKDTSVMRGELNHLSQFVVIGQKNVADPTPRVVLDPDNDKARINVPPPAMSELPLSISLSVGVSGLLASKCHANVLVTRTDPADDPISQETRAGMAAAFEPDVVLTVAFDALNANHMWGDPKTADSEGGSKVYDDSQAMSADLSSFMVSNLPAFTTRRAVLLGDARFPYPAFAGLDAAVVHLETLYMDNVNDRPVIDMNFGGIINGVYTGLGRFLEAHGYNCTDYSPGGGWPQPPSADDIARWRQLGQQYYQAYGAEPVSFATGNLFEKFPLLSMTGAGSQSTDVGLFYNSQDGRDTRVGAGWSFALGARAQRFADGSVMIVRGDAASYLYTPNGNGGFNTPAGAQATLTDIGGGLLKLVSDPSGTGAASGPNETWVFNASADEGYGDLISHTDALGNITTLTYGTANDQSLFTPLTSITDASGQVISVGSDAQGRVTSFTLPDGRSWGLAYDGDGNLSSIGYPNASSQTFTYDGAGHHLITATDGLGTQYLRNEYDASARVVKQWDAENTQRSFTYEPGKTTYVDNEGNTHVFHMDAQFHVTQVDNPDGSTSKYDVNGNDQTTSSTDENGGRWDYEYDAAGNLTKQTAPADSNSHRAITSYTYAPGGQVASVTDEGGLGGAARTTSYDVDAAGRTTAAHFPNGTSETYVYDVAGNVTSVTDAAGGVTAYTYNTSGDVMSKTDALGNVTTYAYDGGGHLITQTDALGGITRFEWSGENLTASVDPLGARTTYSYDVNNHMTSMTDPLGRTTSYGWDSMFRPSLTTAADGGVSRIEYNREDVAAAIIDPLGRRTMIASNARKQTTGATAPDGGVIANVLDAGGRVTSSTNALGGITDYTYDALGNVLTATNPLGGVTTYAYDVVGRVVSMTDPAGGVTSYAYDVMDNQVTITDPTGGVTTSVFDGLGRVTGYVNARGDGSGYAYDAVGNQTTTTDSEGNAWTASFDVLGRQTEMTDPNGGVTTWVYDKAGRVTSRTDAEGNITTTTYDLAGQITETTDAMGQATSYAYDPVGRVASVTDPLGAVTSTVWDKAGQRVETVDANGVPTAYTYDDGGHLASVTQNVVTTPPSSTPPAPSLPTSPSSATPVGGVDPVNVKTSYEYDPAGNLVKMVDANGSASTYGYDAAGNPTEYVNGIGSTWTNTYDRSGRVVASVEPNGTKTTQTYDADGRVSLSSAKAKNGGSAQASYGYDALGQLITMTDNLGTSAWAYDSSGRVTQAKDSLGQELAYVYDKVGNLTSKTLPSGATEAFTYNKIGLPLTQSTPAGELGYAWNANRQPTGITRQNGLTSSYGYDADGRVTSILHANPNPVMPSPQPTATASLTGGSQDTVASCITAQSYLQSRVAGLQSLAGQRAAQVPQSIGFDYTYDAAGNVTSRTRTNRDAAIPTGPIAPSDTRTYSYDALDRLTGSVATTTGAYATKATTAYGYDLVGNRTSASTTTTGQGGTVTESMAAVFDAANQITTAATTGIDGAKASTAYGYDASGNRISQTVTGATQVKTGFEYTPTGKLAQVTTPERTTSFGYDGLGRALTSTTTTPLSTDTTTSTWDGLDITEQSSKAFGTTTYGRDVLGNVAYQASGNTKIWDLTDALGSTIGQADGATIMDLADYTDYGTQRFATDTWNTPFNYTGETTDPVLGLNYYYARTYDPTTASFTSNDPYAGNTASPQTLNRHSYVGGNPTSRIDNYGFIYNGPQLSDGGPTPSTKRPAATCPRNNGPFGICWPTRPGDLKPTWTPKPAFGDYPWQQTTTPSRPPAKSGTSTSTGCTQGVSSYPACTTTPRVATATSKGCSATTGGYPAATCSGAGPNSDELTAAHHRIGHFDEYYVGLLVQTYDRNGTQKAIDFYTSAFSPLATTVDILDSGGVAGMTIAWPILPITMKLNIDAAINAASIGAMQSAYDNGQCVKLYIALGHIYVSTYSGSENGGFCK